MTHLRKMQLHFLLVSAVWGCATLCARAAVHIGRVGQIHCPWSENATPGWQLPSSQQSSKQLELFRWAIFSLQVGPLSWCPSSATRAGLSLSQGVPAEGGNTKQLPAPRWPTVTRGSCPVSQTTSGQCCVPRAAQVLVWHSLPFPSVLLLESIPITSECCCFADFVSPFPQSLTLAGVAVSSTLLATTKQRAVELECWEGGGFALESVGAQICREAGARVSTNVFVRDLEPNVQDTRKLEIVAKGLLLYGGAQLAVDTTLVSAHQCDGTAKPGPAHIDGAALVVDRRRKEKACPKLVGPQSRAKLVVLAGEVGGRWSEEMVTFLRLLAAARARSESALLRRNAEQACRMWWGRDVGVRCSTRLRCFLAGTALQCG